MITSSDHRLYLDDELVNPLSGTFVVKKFFDLVALSRRCHDMKMVTTSGQRECHKVYLLPLIFLSALEGGSSASSISRDSSLS